MIVEKIDVEKSDNIFDLWEAKRSWIESSDFYFSFSKLKQFRQSPKNFVEYILGTAQKSDSMRFGQVDHVFILEGEKVFNTQYTVLDRPTDLRSNESKNGKIGKTEYSLLIEEAASVGKSLVHKPEIEKAKRIREMLEKDEMCNWLIKNCQAEQSIDYKLDYNGSEFRFKGRIDGVGKGYKFDLKNIANFQSKNMRDYIFRENLHIQAAIYQMSECGSFDDDYYILAANEQGVLPIHLKRSVIERGVKDLYKILDKFELCKLEYRWFESNGFWHRNGVLEID